MKFDKDFVMKNRFWMLLGVAMPMALLTLFLLFTAVTAGIDEKRSEIEKQLKELEGALGGSHPNDKWIEEKKAEADKLFAQESEVWKKAYFAQDLAGLASWPKTFDARFHYSDGYFARAVEVQKKVDNEKDFFKGDTPAEDLKESIFTGILEEFNEEFLIVKGLNADKEQEARKFHRTAEVKVAIEGTPKAFFPQLQDKENHVLKIKYEKSRYFDDPMTESEIRAYAATYKEQIPEILQMVDPVNDKGEGVVQLRGWPYAKGQMPLEGATFLRFKANEWDTQSMNFSSEAWLAQEDLWVQREIYRMVRQANDYVSEFKGTGGSERNKPYVFTNPNWKVEIIWRGGKDIDYKVYNLLSRKQKVDVGFRVKIHKALDGEAFTPPVEPLSPKGSKGQDVYAGKYTFAATPQGIFGVNQVLNWETAAVKRIDLISIGSPQEVSHGHRTLPRGYKPLKAAPVAAAVTTEGSETAPAAPAAGTVPGGEQPPGPGTSGFGQTGVLGAAATRNGFVLDRYVDVMKEARRIPVAVVLIVDQEHIDRVHTSFGNSKLRFLMTQCLMSRYPQSLRPVVGDPLLAASGGSLPGEGSMPPGPPGPGFSGFGRGGERSGGEEPGFGGVGLAASGGTTSFQGGSPGLQLGTTDGVVDESEANVELVIYGIVTLYQRYPARIEEAPPAAATTEQPKEAAKEAPK